MKKYLLIACLFALTFTGCKSDKESGEASAEQEATLSSEATANETEAVCIWDQISVRDLPSEKGKWLTSINLGEKVTYLGVKKVDSVSERTYAKVRLSDGKEGWSLADFIIPEGRPAVFLHETEYYKRPDLMTKSGNSFLPMDIVAICSEQGDWVEVRGKRKDMTYLSSGWVKPENISTKEVDLAVAKYASAAIKETDDKKLAALKEIVENADFSSSHFIADLRDEIATINQAVTHEMDNDPAAMDEDSVVVSSESAH